MCLHDFNLCSDKSWALSTLGSSQGGRAAGFLPVWRSLVGADSELKKKGKKKKGNCVLLCSRAAGGGREGSCGGGVRLRDHCCCNSLQLHSWLMRAEFFFLKNQHVSGGGDGGRDRDHFFFSPVGSQTVSVRRKKKQRVLPLKWCEGFLFTAGERQGVEHRVLCKLRMGSSAVWQAWELSHRPWVLWVGETFFFTQIFIFFLGLPV